MKILRILSIFILFWCNFTEGGEKSYLNWENVTNSVKITIFKSKNIQKTCEKESKKRGNSGFGFALEACSFWKDSLFGRTCDVFVTSDVNQETFAHELKHCFQGDFHKNPKR